MNKISIKSIQRIKKFIANVSRSLQSFPEDLINEKRYELEGRSPKDIIDQCIEDLLEQCSELESSFRVERIEIKDLKKFFFDRRKEIKDTYEFLLYSLKMHYENIKDRANTINNNLPDDYTCLSVDIRKKDIGDLLKKNMSLATDKIERILEKIEGCTETEYCETKDNFWKLSEFENFIDSIVLDAEVFKSRPEYVFDPKEKNHEIFEKAINDQYINAFKICMHCASQDFKAVDLCFTTINEKIDKFYHFQKNTIDLRLRLLDRPGLFSSNFASNYKKIKASAAECESGLSNIRLRLDGKMHFTGMKEDMDRVTLHAKLLKSNFLPQASHEINKKRSIQNMPDNKTVETLETIEKKIKTI